MSELLETDVLVIGCGIAGGVAALELADVGVEVTLVTRAQTPEDTNTVWAQGGIIFQGANDSPADLAQDLLNAGAHYNYGPAVHFLAAHGPRLVQEILIDKLHTPFDRTPQGELSTVLEGAHSHPRIIHAADATGRAIEISLLNALRNRPNVQLLTGHTAVDLLTQTHHALDRRAVYERPACLGAYLYDQNQRQVRRCLARQTILASGGLGQIFLRTSNPPGARGDGLAMAYRAGARVINCEFIQFHPTTFHQLLAPHFLISEAVRGAGARLVHANGEPFMQRYAPEWRDLAARDVVARSIHEEMATHDLPHVYLDLRSYIPEATIREHFPNILASCLAYGVDITRDLVPVVPAAHYFCGGVWVEGPGLTTLDNLYAVGEVSCTGLHGANRLASSSLLEGLVWGYHAAHDALAHLPGRPRLPADLIPPWQDTGREEPDPILIQQDMNTIRHIMWNYVGLVRSTRRLERALRELRHLEDEIERFYRVSRLTDELIGLRNAIRTAIVVTEAAWRNKHSIGCHYRVD